MRPADNLGGARARCQKTSPQSTDPRLLRPVRLALWFGGCRENGRFVALEPDPSHPTGKALCAKGRRAPELVYHPDRLLYPLKRTRPKGDPDPGWQRISWDEALDLTAARLRGIAAEHGPQSVVFSVVFPVHIGLGRTRWSG